MQLAGELVKGATLDRAQGRNHRADRTQRHDVLGDRRRRPGPAGAEQGEAAGIAADSEATVAAKDALAIEYRKSGKLDHEMRAAIAHRPGDAEPAPGVAARHCERDLALGIQGKLGYQL